MHTDGSAFLRRALAFLDACRRGWHPNAGWLVKDQEISLPTARRVINRLRDEYGAPLVYVERHKGWELTAPWFFPGVAAVHRDELAALWHAVRRAAGIDDELDTLLTTLTDRLAAQLAPDSDGSSVATRSRATSSQAWSAQTSLPAGMLLALDKAVAERRWVSFAYASPWKTGPRRARRVAPLHLRLHDTRAYLLGDEQGHEKLFHLAHVHDLEIEQEQFPARPTPAPAAWDDAAGIWRTGPVLNVTVRLTPPGARHQAPQRWHAQQRDAWDGEFLERTFPARRSPELTARLLSLGQELLAVTPEQVAEDLAQASASLAGRLARRAG